MKLYTVIQETFTEGNFGDLEAGHSIHHGVFSTRETAQEYVDNYSVETFEAQFGDSDEKLYIIESELNIPLISDNWNW